MKRVRECTRKKVHQDSILIIVKTKKGKNHLL